MITQSRGRCWNSPRGKWGQRVGLLWPSFFFFLINLNLKQRGRGKKSVYELGKGTEKQRGGKQDQKISFWQNDNRVRVCVWVFCSFIVRHNPWLMLPCVSCAACLPFFFLFFSSWTSTTWVNILTILSFDTRAHTHIGPSHQTGQKRLKIKEQRRGSKTKLNTNITTYETQTDLDESRLLMTSFYVSFVTVAVHLMGCYPALKCSDETTITELRCQD